MSIFFQNNEQYYTNIDMARFVDFDNENSGRPSFLTSYIISQIRQIKNYSTMEIESKYIDSPDFISYSKYQGQHMYWWIIMIYNNLLDFNELTFGKQIKIPNISDVNRILSNLQTTITAYEDGDVSKIEMSK